MSVELVSALASGVLGGAAMVGVGLLVPSSRFDVAALWAGLLALPVGAARAGGLVVHVAVSGAVGVMYALGFRLAEASDARAGLRRPSRKSGAVWIAAPTSWGRGPRGG